MCEVEATPDKRRLAENLDVVEKMTRNSVKMAGAHLYKCSRIQQLLTDKIRVTRLPKDKMLRNQIKNLDKSIVRICSNKKMRTVDQVHKSQNDR